jgi:mono/diheme cytochrome c family protein
MRLHALLCSVVALSALSACGGDDDPVNEDTSTSSGGSGGSTTGGGGSGGSGTTGTTGGGGNGGTAGAPGGSAGMGGGAGEGGAPVDPEVARGEYLVNVVSVCADCHTPRKADGSPDLDMFLAGAECFIDADPADDEVGCLSTRNLTNHETGLMNRSDDEIKDLFMEGIRPDGSALHPVMPYWSFGNMTEEDADAIVAYLRTVPGVDHELPPAQPPFIVDEPAPRVDLDQVPEPDSDDDTYESAMRGRYLAAQAGVCLECHTPETEPPTPEPRDLSLAFAGGSPFNRDQLGLPPIFPADIFPANLTSDETGLEGYSVEDIVRVLKEGVGPTGDPVCPPMPAGPMGPYAHLTDEDATDIATYLLTLPPISNELPACELPE